LAAEPAEPAKKKTGKPTMAEKIAPKKRDAEEATRRRERPAPRGRFVNVGASKQPVEELSDPAASELLASMIEQHGHRVAIARALSVQYVGKGGAPLAATDIEKAIDAQKLSSRLHKRESELVLSSYGEHKGASGRVAWALGISPAELDKLVKALDLTREVDESRERYRREALAPRNFGWRLDLLGRSKYLDDLDIKRRFNESLGAEVRQLIGSVEGATVDALVQAAAKKRGVAPELLARAVDKLGIAAELKRQLSGESQDHV
jgi:hypothetical protein